MGDLVSCLCVSRPRRYGQLQRAVLNFLAQTYEPRELVIAVGGNRDFPAMVQSFVDGLPAARNVRVVARPVTQQLDGLQYAAVLARGEILAVWDDDDLSHPARLAQQVEIQGKHPTAVTALTTALYHFRSDGDLFVLGPGDPNLAVGRRLIPATLMAYREHFPVLEPAARGRTTERLLDLTVRHGKKVADVDLSPWAYLVGVTQDNVRGYEFHRGLVQAAARPVEWIEAHRAALTAALGEYAWDGPVQVEGRDGGAFAYEPPNRWPAGLHPVRLDAPPPRLLPKPKEPKA